MVERKDRDTEFERAVGKVDAWFLESQEEIGATLERRRQFYWDVQYQGVRRDTIDLACRTLSEMPLCTVLDELDARGLPAGFEYVAPGIGWVKIGEELMGEGCEFRTYHGFFYNPTLSMVVCPTFGQFVHLTETRRPGDRLAYLAKRFPHLVTLGERYYVKGKVRTELAILRGSVDEIRETGLSYGDREGNLPKGSPISKFITGARYSGILRGSL